MLEIHEILLRDYSSTSSSSNNSYRAPKILSNDILDKMRMTIGKWSYGNPNTRFSEILQIFSLEEKVIKKKVQEAAATTPVNNRESVFSCRRFF